MLGGKKAVYHVDRTVKETKKLFGDEAHIIYVNGEYRGRSPVGKLMHDFNCANPDEMKIKVLADRARYFKQDDKGVRQMCKAMEELFLEGIEEGKAEGREEIIIEMLKGGKLSDAEIAKYCRTSVSAVKRIRASLKTHIN